MANETPHPPSLNQTILQMIQAALTGNMTFETLNNLLSLICLLSIIQRMPPSVGSSPSPSNTGSGGGTADGLQKLLGQLTKGENGSGDALMNLLPLLNSPQLKSKMTPANMAAILGLLNTMNSSNESKPEKSEKEKDGKKESPAATVTTDMPDSVAPPVQDMEVTASSAEPEVQEKPRYLEWKTNF